MAKYVLLSRGTALSLWGLGSGRTRRLGLGLIKWILNYLRARLGAVPIRFDA